MRRIYTKKRDKFFIAILFVMIFAISLGYVSVHGNLAFAANTQTQTAAAEEVSGLDTDKIAGSDLTIRDYPEQLHATEAAVRLANIENEGDVGFEVYGLQADDPITDIVPKDRFFTVGQELEMGDEYGYFIKTTATERGNYLSTVLVFDITTDTDLVATIDRVIIEVSPVFQYRYVGLTNNATSEFFSGYLLSYDTLDEPCVVAYPSKMENSAFAHKVEYEMTEEYYLKDVSFGASLYNEQTLNRGDDGYDPYNDYGSYFTGFDYAYQGKYREYGEFGLENVGAFLYNTATCMLGFFDKFQIINKLGKLFSVVSLVEGWIDFGDAIYKNVVGEVKTAEKKITATCYYQNRDDQLKYYADDEGNPFLVRNAVVAIDTGNEQSMWYGIGDNVTAYFNIGHSALNGRTPNYTRFTDQLALQIVSSDGDQVVAAGDTIIHDTLRAPETKELEFLSDGDIYMLPNGQDHLLYDDVMYESDYDVQIDLSDNATVTVNGESQYGKDLSFTVHAKEHDDIAIDLKGSDVGLQGNVSISPNDSTSIDSIAPHGRYMLKTDLNGMKTLQTGNLNLVIEDIFTHDESGFDSYENLVPLEEGASVTDLFEGGQDYYIVIYNDSSTTANNVTLQINGIQSFGPEQSITVSADMQVMSFLNTYDEEMSFQLILPQQGGVNSISVFNSDGQSIGYATVTEVGDTKYSFGLQAGEECYIFYSLSTSVTFTVLPDEQYLKWEIDGEIYNVDYKVSLPRGASYDIRLLYCKDNYTYEVITAYNISDRSDYFTFSNDILTITYYVPYTYEITIVPVKYPNATLRIIPTEGREDIDYTITFDNTGGSGMDSVEANYNRDMPEATEPSKKGYKFLGYYSEMYGRGTQYYDSNMISIHKWDKEEDAILYAYWEAKTYNITFHQREGSGGTTSDVATYGELMPLITLPKRTGYNFLGYYTTPYGGTCYYNFFDSDAFGEEYYYLYYAYICDFDDNIDLYARWEPMTWRVSVWASLSDAGKTTIPDQSFSLSCDEAKTYYIPGIQDYDFVRWTLTYQFGTIASGTSTSINMKNLCVGNYTSYTLTIYYNYNPQPSCIAAGTLITLADGRQVPVEMLTGTEMLLVWNMKTGTYDVAPIMFIDSDPLRIYTVINLSFSDGTTVDVISEHGFWDVDLNRYVYLDEDASQYIGHSFLKQAGNGMAEVTLVGVEISEETTMAYSPVTYGHLCYYVNGMLSMPGGITGLFNIFEVDAETMTIDEEAFAADIEEYGLFTYEEFYEMYPVSEEVFDAFNGKYLKVAIGKGMITEEQIGVLIERYSEFF